MKRKVLCICNGGNVRSTMLAEVLKGTLGCEAIAVGTYWTSPDTMNMLCNWADIIAPVEPLNAILPEPDLTKWKASPIWNYTQKLKIAKIGPDAWGHPKWQELHAHCVIAGRELLS